MLLANTPTKAESQVHNVQHTASGIGLYINADKKKYIILNGGSLKSVDKFTYVGSSVPFTESDISMRLAKTWAAIDWLLFIWNSD